MKEKQTTIGVQNELSRRAFDEASNKNGCGAVFVSECVREEKSEGSS